MRAEASVFLLLIGLGLSFGAIRALFELFIVLIVHHHSDRMAISCDVDLIALIAQLIENLARLASQLADKHNLGAYFVHSLVLS